MTGAHGVASSLLGPVLLSLQGYVAWLTVFACTIVTSSRATRPTSTTLLLL
jgi:hypothetical protein